MIPFEVLTDLFELAMARWSPGPWATAPAPTADSISRIDRHLGVRIPEDFVRLASACPSYGSWFASIGDDFDRGLHITKLNQLFHDASQLHDEGNGPALAGHLIMLNHGHDGDCDCWDTTRRTATGEHPIVYVRLDAQEPSGAEFGSFRAYAEQLTLRHARGVADRAQRRRVRRLLENFEP